MRSRMIAHLTRVRTTQLCYLYNLIKDWTSEMLHALEHLKHGMNQRTIFYACTEYHSYIMPINGRKDEVFEMPKVLRNSNRKKKKKMTIIFSFYFSRLGQNNLKKEKRKKKGQNKTRQVGNQVFHFPTCQKKKQNYRSFVINLIEPKRTTTGDKKVKRNAVWVERDLSS